MLYKRLKKNIYIYNNENNEIRNIEQNTEYGNIT